jgi:thioredoxin reductase (NADPH)
VNEEYDLLVVGAGPAGLATGIEARRRGLSCIILDLGSIAHNISLFQREMPFFSTPELLEIGDVPFVVSGTRPTSLDCVNYYRSVAERHSLEFRFYRRVTVIRREGGGFVVVTANGEGYRARNVVIATGYYLTPKRLGVPGEHLPHVNSYYRDPLPYYRQNVLIVGGKNSAVEAALDLWRHGAKVTVVHRGAALSGNVKYWILPDFENRVASGAIEFLTTTTVSEFKSGSTILRRSDGTLIERPTDFAFTLIGYEADTGFLRECGIGVDPGTGAPVHDPATMETGVQGLFVAGGMVGGRFNNAVFIENGRLHGKMIVDEVAGRLAGRPQRVE